VNSVCARPPLQFFECLAEVIQDLTVDEFDLSIRCEDRKESGNPVDDLPKSEIVLHRDFFDGALSTQGSVVYARSVRRVRAGRSKWLRGIGGAERARTVDLLSAIQRASARNHACQTGRKKLMFSVIVVKDSSGAKVEANAIPMAAPDRTAHPRERCPSGWRVVGLSIATRLRARRRSLRHQNQSVLLEIIFARCWPVSEEASRSCSQGCRWSRG